MLGNLRESDEPPALITRQVLGTNVLTDDMLLYSGSQVFVAEDWLTFDDREPNNMYLSAGTKYAKLKYNDNGVLKDIPASLGFSYQIQFDGALTNADGRYYGQAIMSNQLVSDFDIGSGLYTFFLKSGFTFDNTSPSAGGKCILIQPDTKIVLAGHFSKYQGKTANNIIRLNNDGTVDTSFVTGTGFNGKVLSMVLLPSGKIIAVGEFTKYNDVDANWIVCLNSDGSIDTSFTTNLGAGITGGETGYIRKIKLAAGALFVCGWSFNVNGVQTNGFAKLAIDGTPDAAYNANIAAITHTQVRNFDVYPDGKVILCGIFTITTTKSVVKLAANGTVDGTFTPLFQLDINHILIHSSGDFICAGSFTNWAGSGIAYLAKISSTGVQDTIWKLSGVTIQTNMNPINYLAELSDGKIIFNMAAVFTFPGSSTSRKGFLVINSDGSAVTDIIFPFIDGATSDLSIAFDADDKVLIGGNLGSVSNKSSLGFVRLNADLTMDTTSSYPWSLYNPGVFGFAEIDGVLCVTSASGILGPSFLNFKISQNYGTGTIGSLSSGISS